MNIFYKKININLLIEYVTLVFFLYIYQRKIFSIVCSILSVRITRIINKSNKK